MPKFCLLPTLKALLCVLFACVSLSLSAQYDNGSLLGTIKDATGAPIPGASVTITNTATSIAVTTRTNASGDYNVPQLRVGLYKVSAKAQGFSDAVADKVTVSVGNRQEINLSLQVGGEATTVEVSDVALQLETDTSERGQTITNYQSEAFPLVSRNYSDLLALVPGSASGTHGDLHQFGQLAGARRFVQRERRAQHVQ